MTNARSRSPKSPQSNEWFELGSLEPDDLLGLYAPEGLITFVFRIGPAAHDHHMRYDHARSHIASIVNTSRAKLRGVVDVWLGQSSDRGRYAGTMRVTFASSQRLPVDLLTGNAQTSSLVATATGRHPVTDGIYPELRVRDSVVSGKWALDVPLMFAFSRLFRTTHGLEARTRDGYVQMALGSDEPADFAWHRENAPWALVPDVVLSIHLAPSKVPAPSASPELIDRFARTFDPGVTVAAWNRTERRTRAVQTRLDDGLTLDDRDADDLRAWLLLTRRRSSALATPVETKRVLQALKSRLRAHKLQRDAP